MNGYDAYNLYNSIKLHFTQESYDAFKYNFKSNTNVRTFEKKKERYFFEKLSRRYNAQQLKLYFVDNIIEENNWIGDMREHVNNDREKYRQSMFYNFKEECKKIRSEIDDFDEACQAKDGTNKLLELYMASEISIDTIAIINNLVKFIRPLKKQLSDPLGIMKENLHRIIKYEYFILDTIRGNREKYRNYLFLLFTKQPNEYNIDFVYKI